MKNYPKPDNPPIDKIDEGKALEDRVYHGSKKDFFKYNFLQSFKTKYSDFKNWATDTTGVTVDALRNATVRAYIIGAIGLAGSFTAGNISYKEQDIKSHSMRIAFSETTDIEKELAAKDQKMPHMTNLLTKLNDFYMKVFEAYNLSWENSATTDNTKTLATELYAKIDPISLGRKPHTHEFPQLVKEIVESADSVVAQLQYISQLKDNMNIVGKLMNQSWNDRHHDEYHTEIYLVSVTDYNGKGEVSGSHLEPRTRSVYDYTDNSYTYYPSEGKQASDRLDKIQIQFPKITVEPNFVAATKVGYENQEAMIKSRKEDLKDGKQLSNEDLLKFANSWLYGSRLHKDLNVTREMHGRIMSLGNIWHNQHSKASSYSQRTYNYSHAESSEFQTCENGQIIAKDFNEMTILMINSIIEQKNYVLNIYSGIQDYVGTVESQSISSSNENKNPKKMKSEIISESKKGYNAMFPSGIDIDVAEWGMVALWASLGGLGAGGIAFGANKLAENYGLYEKRKNISKVEPEVPKI